MTRHRNLELKLLALHVAACTVLVEKEELAKVQSFCWDEVWPDLLPIDFEEIAQPRSDSPSHLLHVLLESFCYKSPLSLLIIYGVNNLDNGLYCQLFYFIF